LKFLLIKGRNFIVRKYTEKTQYGKHQGMKLTKDQTHKDKYKNSCFGIGIINILKIE
jgi:hypothetical protein